MALAGFGAMSLLLGHGFAAQQLPSRTGLSHSNFSRWYHHSYRTLGWPLRNAVFLWRPFGVLLLLGAVMAVLLRLIPPAQSTDRVEAMVWLIALAGLTVPMLALLALCFVAMVRPPRFLKPDWFQEDEKRLRSGRPSLVTVPPEGERPVVSRRDEVLVYAMTVVVVAGVAFLRWPPALLMGPAVALPMLVRGRAPSAS